MAVYNFIVFLHVIGAVGLGFYLVMPFLMNRAKSMSGSSLESYLSGLYGSCRVMQYLLIAQLLTGGYMISEKDYSVTWMVLVIVVFIIAAALSGILNGKIKKSIKSLKSAGDGKAGVASAASLSWIVFVSLIAVLYLMMYPMFG